MAVPSPCAPSGGSRGRGAGRPDRGSRTAAGRRGRWCRHAYLLLFSTRGRVYRLRAHEIPLKERTARGTAIVNLLPLGPDERIQAVIDTRDYETNRYLFFATKLGQVKKTRFTEYDSSLRAGLIAINLRDDDELVRVIPMNQGEEVFMVSRQGMTIRFPRTRSGPWAARRPASGGCASARGTRSSAATWRGTTPTSSWSPTPASASAPRSSASTPRPVVARA
jgi:DNA gyrase subunit A